MPYLPDKVEGGLVVRDEQGKPTGVHQIFVSTYLKSIVCLSLNFRNFCG